MRLTPDEGMLEIERGQGKGRKYTFYPVLMTQEMAQINYQCERFNSRFMLHSEIKVISSARSNLSVCSQNNWKFETTLTATAFLLPGLADLRDWNHWIIPEGFDCSG